MKRRRMFWGVAAALLFATGALTACSSDNDENESETVDNRIETEDGKTYVPDSLLTSTERYQLACQSAVMGTMRSLAGLDDVSPDVVNTTHEPTYGQTLDGEGPTVRVVKSESTEDAELSFRTIAALSSDDAELLLTATVDGYMLKLTDLPILPDGKTFTLGTLTFHRDGGPRRYGYVEVSIPCIPHLERIDFLAPSAFPDNANPPYQKGDLVWVPAGHSLCSGYYVCVDNNGYRSTLCHMNKTPNPGDDESINADGDSEGAWKPYNNNHGHETTVDDIKNYVSFMAENKDKVANIKAFLTGKAYNKKPIGGTTKLWHIFPDGFNNDKGVVFNLNDRQSAYIYYDAFITDEYAWVPAYNYRMAKYALVPNNCTKRSQVTTGEKKYVKDSEWNKWLGGNDYTMNVIHAEDVLSFATVDYSALNDKLQFGVYAKSATKDQLGWCYADDGYLYTSRKEAEGYGHTALGVVVYVSDGSDWGKKVTEPDHGGGHGLVMSYREASTSYSEWCNVEEPYYDEYEPYQYIGQYHIDSRNDFNGYDNTQFLDAMGVYAASYAIKMSPTPNPDTTPSGWFIPTVAQWKAAFEGLGGARGNYAYDLWTEPLPDTPTPAINNCVYKRDGFVSLGGTYWTCSASSASEGVLVQCYSSSGNTRFVYGTDYNYIYLRPFLAF